MSWTLLFGLVLVLGLALFALLLRRAELTRMAGAVRERERIEEQGSDQTQFQHPIIDLSRCLGCATCVAVCPEERVLELVHGQAMVVNGARCMGIAACERECPVGAITVTVANLSERDDIPVLSEELESVGSPGLFLAGELTAHALIKSAIEQGAAVGAEVARRVRQNGTHIGDALDLCIIGAGPAGLACSLEAKRSGLRFLTLDQESGLGGTVAKYPRRKLVVTQPVDLPLHGRLKKTSYTKEELIELWERIAREQELPIANGEVFEELERDANGNYLVRTKAKTYTARNVCLALGRRGTPRRLEVPGEELPKVAYSLLDAYSYQGRRILVVGGGDSAVEAAMALAEQPGNEVTLSYRKESFFRLHSRNEKRMEGCLEESKLSVIFSSRVLAIRADAIDLAVKNGAAERTTTLPNDEVFVMTGGTPPLALLEHAGVSFDGPQRKAPATVAEQGTGLINALGVGFALSLSALAWALWHLDYYSLPFVERPAHSKHFLLRPTLGVGLWLGIASSVLIGLNLLYLLRRAPRVPFRFGSLKLWMTSHVATGILALLCAMLHGGMSPRDTPGGHALWAMAVLVVTGAIGRYFYAYVPHAANGRELDLAEVKARLGRMSTEWDQGQVRFRERARTEVSEMVEKRQWKGSFFGRVLALLGVQRDLRRTLAHLEEQGREEGVAQDEIDETMRLARRAHRAALMAAHYEDLRAVLVTWRYVHRWVTALMVLLVVVHIVHALAFGSVFFG
ncbi:MAG: NAD(P)-binding domain-containing protein [Planctomycetota bacterium]